VKHFANAYRPYDPAYQARIAHEVFHAWVGSALRDRNEKRFDDGLWFREGVTQYYGMRAVPVQVYESYMKKLWQLYQHKIKGTPYDIPLVDMPAKGQLLGEDPARVESSHRVNVYVKGALVAYMLDQRLNEKGLSMDDFLRALYQDYALQRRSFTTAQALAVLNHLSGEDWQDFFAQYIYGSAALPLNGNFDYLLH